MKITDLDVTILRLPVVRSVGDGCQTVLVLEIRTDEGITGIGEAHTNPVVSKAIIDAPLGSVSSVGLRELLVGEDPRDINRLVDLMFERTATYGRRGAAVHAISAVEIALWDILGKSIGEPVYRLLGGALRSTVTAYASDLARPSREDTVRMAEGYVADGFAAVKIGWGGLGNNPSNDVDLIGEIRRAIGPTIDIMVDLGNPVSLRDALYLSDAFADYRVLFLEEPLSSDNLSGYAYLTARGRTPIASGEKETTLFPFLDLMDRGGLRIIQPDAARVGGISEMIRIAHHADARGVSVIPHCWTTDILVAASLHVLATLTDCRYLEFNASANPLRTDLLMEPIRPVGGALRVPQGPGLGIELNPETVERYRWDQ